MNTQTKVVLVIGAGDATGGAIAKRFARIEWAGEPTRRLNNTLRALATLPLRFIPA